MQFRNGILLYICDVALFAHMIHTDPTSQQQRFAHTCGLLPIDRVSARKDNQIACGEVIIGF